MAGSPMYIHYSMYMHMYKWTTIVIRNLELNITPQPAEQESLLQYVHRTWASFSQVGPSLAHCSMTSCRHPTSFPLLV